MNMRKVPDLTAQKAEDKMKKTKEETATKQDPSTKSHTHLLQFIVL